MNRRTFLFLAASPLAAQKPGSGKRRVYILLGPPGAGKTTMAKVLKDKYGLPTVAASDLLKKSHGRKSDMSKRLKNQIEGGALLNDDGVNQLVLARISLGDCYNGFVLDGYPTTAAQADFLSTQLKELLFPQPAVVLLDVPDKVVHERLKRRGRPDDTPSNIERRLAEYRAEEAAVLGKFPQVVRVDASGDEGKTSAALLQALAREAS